MRKHFSYFLKQTSQNKKLIFLANSPNGLNLLLIKEKQEIYQLIDMHNIISEEIRDALNLDANFYGLRGAKIEILKNNLKITFLIEKKLGSEDLDYFDSELKSEYKKLNIKTQSVPLKSNHFLKYDTPNIIEHHFKMTLQIPLIKLPKNFQKVLIDSESAPENLFQKCCPCFFGGSKPEITDRIEEEKSVEEEILFIKKI